jgi:ACS family D-galactonate transporter-like MFS transporter
MAGTSFLPLATSGFGLFIPLIREDLALTYTEAGSLAAVATLVYALMQIPSGMLVDRFGPRRLFLAGTLVTNALTIAFALSGSYLQAIAIQALSGLSRALAFAPGLVLMSTWFAPRRRATAMSLFMVGGFLWVVVFSAVGPAAAAATDWRTVFVAFGAIGVVVALVSIAVGRVGRPAPSAVAGPSPIGFWALARVPAMWLVAFVQFARLAVVQGVALWLPTYLVDERDLPLALAGGIVAISALLAAPSNLAGGYAADRTGRPYLVIGGSLGVLGLALAALAVGQGLLAIGLAVVLIACFQQLYFGPLFAAPIGIFGQGSAGLVSGAGNLFANLGAFAAGLGLGVVKDVTGSLSLGFLMLAALCALAVVATWTLARGHPAGAGVESDARQPGASPP